MPAAIDELTEIALAGLDPARDGVACRRIIDLTHVIRSRFGVTYDERSVGKSLEPVGYTPFQS